RLHSRAECDVDYESAAKAWIDALWGPLKAVISNQSGVAGNGLAAIAASSTAATDRGLLTTDHPATYSRNHPFPARLVTNRRLNAPGSAKDTRHFEIALDGSGLGYEVGDALGVMPTNCPVLVEELLASLGFKGEEVVKSPADDDLNLHEALLRHYVITQPP